MAFVAYVCVLQMILALTGLFLFFLPATSRPGWVQRPQRTGGSSGPPRTNQLPCLERFSEKREHCIDIVAVLGTCLHEQRTILLRCCLSLICTNLAQFLKVMLVSNKGNNSLRIRVVSKLCHPM